MPIAAATTVLDQQARNGTAGTGSVPVPADAQFVLLRSTMSDADKLDPAKRCILYLSFSYDGGNTYVRQGPSEWSGGALDRNGNPLGPSVGTSLPLDANGNRPQRAMATLDTEGVFLNTGLTLEFPS